MAYEPKEGDILIFRNEKKKEVNHPDYTGKLFLNGKEYRVACWVKDSNGKKFFSGKVSDPKQKADEPAIEEPSDDLPF